jgi:hypothetical protein
MSDPWQEIVVAVDPQQAPDVVERLREAGMAVDQALLTTGVVTGSVSAARSADISRVEGVIAVEAARRYNLPPPDSPVQ